MRDDNRAADQWAIGETPGELPDAEFAPDPIVIETDAADFMTAARRSLDVLANLPAEAVARVDAFDNGGASYLRWVRSAEVRTAR